MARLSVKNSKTRISKYSLAERITYLRKRRDMTQAELAKKAKVSQSTIAHIENGKKDPSMDTVQRLALALDVHIAILFSEDDVHVFDMKKMKSKYESVDDLNDTVYRAIGEVIRFAKGIGYIN